MDFASLEYDLTKAVTILIARRQRRRRVVRLSAAAGMAAVVLAGVAVGAVHVLGGPAPDKVREEIRAVDSGLPADLRLNPDVVNAHAVAVSESSTLYAAFLKDGGYCTEIVTANERSRGATCSVAADLERLPISITLPTDDNAADSAPVTIGGRINRRGVATIELRYGSGGPTDQLTPGENGFFILDVPNDHRALARHSQLDLTARNSSGAVIARGTVPADWAGPAASDDSVPLFVSTRSTSKDLTKVLGIDGHVNAAGAATLSLRYSGGAVVSIPLDQHGNYHYDVPDSRIHDFMEPRLLVALDAQGHPVAEARVAAVAYWRGRERGR